VHKTVSFSLFIFVKSDEKINCDFHVFQFFF
jgi:hypothetical protein